jgi:hypothetical protein
MFKNKVCPVVFKNANVTLITLELLTNENVLDFIDIANRTSSSNRDLNSHVKFFFINLSEFYLKASLLNPMVFSQLEVITVEYSTLHGIDEFAFKHLNHLKYLNLFLYNLDEFLRNGSDWMRHLNSQVKVDLNDENEIKANLGKQFRLSMFDLAQQFKFSDEDICLFKDFPHDRLVFPLISTSSTIECTCTILWLLKYRKYALNADVTDLINEDSVSNCLDENFEVLLRKCDLPGKLAKCASNQEFKPSNSGVNGLTHLEIILIVSGLVFVLISAMGFYLYRFKKSKANQGELSMSPLEMGITE